ncbi:acetoin utilization AcuB family protein [Lysinibacillus sp. BW-2-10]|uniref:acetoin utilization AcuB family protein n=1 Tax=Lysinibacillus sp. BW-2-10 TaxID=2590030 RepID=UPI00117C9107|nr:acetoin utilization AcuB family protein [Lysinibacillus sp. BW-2-10]TSI03081.1 CBS domain-containing protein [Lysinibacillus sp. BW-2-10]
MIVEEIMNSEVYSLLPTNTVNDAVKLMREKKIRHLPIVDENRSVVGIVTEYDIKNALPSCLIEEQSSAVNSSPIENIMIKDPIIGHPLDFVEEVAVTFYESKISCLPIVSGGQLIGIVTTTDLLYTYIELTGAHKPSSKLDIRVSDKPGTLLTITTIIKKHKANVLSVLVFPDSKNENSRILSIRVQMMNPLSIINDLRNEGFDVLWPHLPGVDL